MSDGHWGKQFSLVIVGVALLLLVSTITASILIEDWVGVHETNAAYQRDAQNERQKAADSMARACRDFSFLKSRNCLRREIETYHENQATNEDLKAQKNMAYWAKLLFGATCAGLAISTWGIFLLIGNLRQGKAVVAQAVKSATEAETANKIALEEARASVSVFVENCEFQATRSGLRVTINVFARKSGTAPATNFFVGATAVKVSELKKFNEWEINGRQREDLLDESESFPVTKVLREPVLVPIQATEEMIPPLIGIEYQYTSLGRRTRVVAVYQAVRYITAESLGAGEFVDYTFMPGYKVVHEQEA